VLVEGRSQRAVARELGLARVTVRKYLAEAVPFRSVEAAPCAASWRSAKAGDAVSMAVFVAKDGGPKAAMQSITLSSTGATATMSMLPNGALR
jgi:DNA-binding transcriptional regulator LsrR (DeoR family)